MDGENPEEIGSPNTSHLVTSGITQEDFEIVPPTTSSLYAAMEENNHAVHLTRNLIEEMDITTEETSFENSKAGSEPNSAYAKWTTTTTTTTTTPWSVPEPEESVKVEELIPCVSEEDRTQEIETEAGGSVQRYTDDDDDLPPPYPPPPPPTSSPDPDDAKSTETTRLVDDTKPVDETKSDDGTQSAHDTKSANDLRAAKDSKSVDDTRTAKNSKSVDTKSGERIHHREDLIDAHYDKLPWALGAVGRLLGLEFAPINIPFSRRLQTFAVLFWMSCFLFMGFGAFFILLYMFFFTQYWWISLAYFTWFLGDKSISSRGGRRWRWVRGWSLWRHYRDFFPIEVIKTADLDRSKNYIMGYHPHGILCAGAFSLFATEGSGFSKLFPGFMPYLLTLGGHFLLPVYREFFMSTGAVSATRESMDYLLGREGSSRALCLVVGGAKEALDCHPGAVTLHLSKRKGFCKMAIRHGASLVPMYSFGENEIYDQVPNPPGSLIRWIQDTLQKVLGVAPCLFMGRGVFQYSFGIVPFRKPIKVVIGKPIDVPQDRKPTRKQIEDLHAEYVAALKKLYEDHKEEYSMFPDREIIIV